MPRTSAKLVFPVGGGVNTGNGLDLSFMTAKYLLHGSGNLAQGSALFGGFNR
jgi:hypothetical protein